MQGAGYELGSKFARGAISVLAFAVVCLDLTIDKMEAERAELIAIILNVAKNYAYIIYIYIIFVASIDERLEHDLETNRGNELKCSILVCRQINFKIAFTMLFRAEKCTDILKCMVTTIG